MKKAPKRTTFDCAGMLLWDEVSLFVPKGHVCTVKLPIGQFTLTKVDDKSKHRHPTMEAYVLHRRGSEGRRR